MGLKKQIAQHEQVLNDGRRSLRHRLFVFKRNVRRAVTRPTVFVVLGSSIAAVTFLLIPKKKKRTKQSAGQQQLPLLDPKQHRVNQGIHNLNAVVTLLRNLHKLFDVQK